MPTRAIDRRTFNQTLAMSVVGATMAAPSWAQGRKRNLTIGHTGITWPGRAAGRRGAAPGAGTAGAPPPAPTTPPAAGAAGPQGVSAGAPRGSRRLRREARVAAARQHQPTPR